MKMFKIDFKDGSTFNIFVYGAYYKRLNINLVYLLATFEGDEKTIIKVPVFLDTETDPYLEAAKATVTR